jgi:16S rRNA (adenine1518-N6/adenine1519-N6)-dimethyltransferase
MTERSAVRALLARRGLAAHRDRGQNFLVDPAIAAAIADAAGIAPGDAVIEIGPGLGILTRALAARAARVCAIEIDAGLVRALAEEGELPANVELLHGDALAVDLASLARRLGPSLRVVANLPYSASAPILRRLLDLRGRLRGWLVLVQREMALRLVARPGQADYGSLAVLHALCVRLERVRDLPPACFHPVPKVTSTLVRATPLEAGPLAAGSGPGPGGRDELADLERVVRAAFGTRRKTLANALRAGLEPAPPQEALHGILDRLGIDRRSRAEALAPETFLALARALRGGGAADQ